MTTVWIAECIANQCADGSVVKHFNDQATREQWAVRHTEALGHVVLRYQRKMEREEIEDESTPDQG